VSYIPTFSQISLSLEPRRGCRAHSSVSVFFFFGYWRRVAHANWYHTSPNCGYHGDSADSPMLGEQAMIMQLSGEAIVQDWGDESAEEPHTDVATNALDQAFSATPSAKESFLLGRQMQRPQPNDMVSSAHYATCPFTGSRHSPPGDVRNSPSVRWSGSTAADPTGLFVCSCVSKCLMWCISSACPSLLTLRMCTGVSPSKSSGDVSSSMYSTHTSKRSSWRDPNRKNLRLKLGAVELEVASYVSHVCAYRYMCTRRYIDLCVQISVPYVY